MDVTIGGNSTIGQRKARGGNTPIRSKVIYKSESMYQPQRVKASQMKGNTTIGHFQDKTQLDSFRGYKESQESINERVEEEEKGSV